MKAVTPFLAIALLLAGLAGNAEAQRKAKPRDAMKLSPPVKVGRADIGGVVSGEKGPEAGVWVIAETSAGQSCHALGTPGMRTVPKIFMEKGDSVEAGRERLKSGGAMALMARDIGRLDGERAIRLFAEWTERIAAGELPFAHPERPKGVERNIVLTLWDWSQPTAYLH